VTEGSARAEGSVARAETAPPLPDDSELRPGRIGVGLHAADEQVLPVQVRRATRRRGWLVARMLVLADLTALLTAFVAAETFFGGRTDLGAVQPELELLVFLASLPGWVIVAKVYGLYDRDDERMDHSTADELTGVFHLVTVGAWLFYAFSWFTGLVQLDFEKLLGFWAMAVVLVAAARAFARLAARRSLWYLQNAVIVGAGDVGQLIGRKILRHPEYGLNVVGFVDGRPKERHEDLRHLTLLGPPERLAEIVRTYDVERVIVAFSNATHVETLELVRAVKDLDVQIDIVPRLFEVVGSSVGIHTVEGIPLVGMPPLRLSNGSRILKRALDLTLSGLAFLLLAPFLVVVAIAIKLDSPGPVFFRQVRRGGAEGLFRIYKFRTMTVDADERKEEVAHLNAHAAPGGDPRMFKIQQDPRVTRVGAIARRYSIDELPQLINVLLGQMSLVGPRPLILDEDQYVETWGRRRLDLKPGMTGLWQVLGRSEIPFGEMVKLDYIYVTSWSLWSDIRLLVRTVPAIFRAGSGLA